MQDIGQLALMQQLGPSYLQFLNHLQLHGGNVLEQELETLGFDHLIFELSAAGPLGPAGFALCGGVRAAL